MIFFPSVIQETEVEIEKNILKISYLVFFFSEETNQQNSPISLQLRIV